MFLNTVWEPDCLEVGRTSVNSKPGQVTPFIDLSRAAQLSEGSSCTPEDKKSKKGSKAALVKVGWESGHPWTSSYIR